MPAPSFFFISGGCRSGKSAYAQTLAESLGRNGRGLYIATAYAADEEMRGRVRAHQEARGPNWRLFEMRRGEAGLLARRLPELVRPGEAVLFDCLTLWVSACMDEPELCRDFAAAAHSLCSAFRALPVPVVTVHDETGMGLVPEHPSSRLFRDMAGTAGQIFAASADAAFFMVSGLPLVLKGRLPNLNKR